MPKYLTIGALVAVAAFLMYSLLPQEPETAMLVPVAKMKIAPKANEPEMATIEEGQQAELFAFGDWGANAGAEDYLKTEAIRSLQYFHPPLSSRFRRP